MPRVYNVRFFIKSFSTNTNTNFVGTEITDRVIAYCSKQSLFMGRMKWRMVLQSVTVNSEEDLMFDQGVRQIKITQERDGVEQSTGWITIVVEKSMFQYNGGKPYVIVEGSDRSVFLRSGNDLWNAYINRTASDVFSEIALRNRLVPSVKQTAGVGTWYQTGESDWELAKQLRAESITAEGQRNAYFYIENEVLRYGNIDYAKPAVRRYVLGSGDDRVEGINYSANIKEAEYDGSNFLTTSNFDVMSKQYNTIPSFDSNVPSLGNTLPNVFGSSKKYQTIPQQNFNDLFSIANRSWMEKTLQNFSCVLEVIGDVALRLGDIVEAGIVGPNGGLSSFNGRYPIFEIKQEYYTYGLLQKVVDDLKQKDGLSTKILCYRRTFNYGSIAATGANYSSVNTIDDYSVDNIPKENATIITARPL